MSDLTPANSVSRATTSGGGNASEQNYQSAPARVVNLPSALQGLSQNVMLGARLVGANPDGSVVLRTARGDVTLDVPVKIPPGAQLQVQLQPGNPPSAVLILAAQEQGGRQGGAGANGGVGVSPLMIETGSAQSQSQAAATAAAKPDVTALVTNNTQNLPELKQNVIIRALVMQAVQILAEMPGGSSLGVLANKPEVLANMLEQMAAKLPTEPGAQTQLLAQLGLPGKLPTQFGNLSFSGNLLEVIQKTIQLLQQQPDGAKGLSNDQRALLQLLQAGQPQAGNAPQLGAPSVTSQLFPGMELNLKLVQIVPPQAGTANPAPVTILPNASGALVVTGQIAPQLVNGQPVVQTEHGNILLQASSKLPVGTTVVFELLPQAAVPADATVTANVLKTSSPLPKLELALQTLAQVNGDLFQTLTHSLPKLNGQFPVTALFFFQALRTGDVKNWLGEKTLQALGQAGGESAKLAAAMGKEFSGISARARDALPGEWRQITLPYMGEQGLSAMRFAVRDHFQPVTEDNGAATRIPYDPAARITRFLFDLEFSEMGAMQVDGLIRPSSAAQKQMDIVLRSREMLPSEMRRELRELFSESLGAYGMTGALSFQSGFQNWVRLAEERSRGAKV